MFDALFHAEGVEVLLTPPRGAPGERVRGALGAHGAAGMPGPDPDLNTRHLLTALREYLAHYNGHRPHQGRGQRPPERDTLAAPVANLGAVRLRRRSLVHGLINEYEQAAVPEAEFSNGTG